MAAGARIKALREALGESQEQFASRFGVTKRTVIGWEAGKAVRRRHCPDIAALADVTEAEFFFGEDVCEILAEIEIELSTILKAFRLRSGSSNPQRGVEWLQHLDDRRSHSILGRELSTLIVSELIGKGEQYDVGVKAAADFVKRLFSSAIPRKPRRPLPNILQVGRLPLPDSQE